MEQKNKPQIIFYIDVSLDYWNRRRDHYREHCNQIYNFNGNDMRTRHRLLVLNDLISQCDKLIKCLEDTKRIRLTLK